MYLRFFNDIHWRGIPQVMTYDELKYLVTTSPYPVILGGDIYDFSGCPVADLPKLYQEATLLNTYVREHHGFVLEGNHSCYAYEADEELLLAGKLLFIHGHRAMWSDEKCEKFMQQSKGAGWFKRNLISRLIANLRRFKEVRPNVNFLKYIEAKKLQYPQLTHIVSGHSHPPEMVRFTHAGVDVRIMPQGVCDLNLPI